MIIHRPAVAVLAVCALAAFGAHKSTAPNEDHAPSTGVVDAAHIATNEVASVSTNSAEVSSHQRLIDAWKDVENVGDATPLKTISLPLTHYPDGSIRIMFRAKEALLPNDKKSYLRAKNIWMDLYSPPEEGHRVDGVFLADNGIYDRVLRDGYSEGWVRLTYRNVSVVGTNMTWNLDTRRVKITGGSHVTIENGLMKGMGGMFRK